MGEPSAIATFMGAITGFIGWIFASTGLMLQQVLAAIDPICGPVGVFKLFAEGTQLACGNTGWGDEIARGFMVTASLAICTLPVGLLMGFFLALAKQSREKTLRLAADIYTTLFRSLPELLTLFIIYYGLQILIQQMLAYAGYDGRIEINAFFAGMIALGMVFSAYCSEVLLSAFKAIPHGQYEAGNALGLRRSTTMRKIIVPQLVRIALPGLGNLWMSLLKDTALVSIVGLPDILRQTGIAAKVTKDAFTFYSVACILFLVLALLSSFIFSWIENQTQKSGTRH